MDILHLVDRLEELFNESRPLPFTHLVMVDEDRMLDLIDQMRVAIPEEIKKAQQITTDKDRIMAKAQEEANRLLAMAREKKEQMVEQDEKVQSAHARARAIIEQANVDAEAIRVGSDKYALEKLTSMEAQLERLMGEIRNGIRELQDANPK